MCRSVCAHECPNVSGAKSLETWVGPSGDLRDVCIRALSPGTTTGTGCMCGTLCGHLAGSSGRFRYVQGVGMQLWLTVKSPPALTTCFHFQPAGSLAFLVCLVPVLCS